MSTDSVLLDFKISVLDHLAELTGDDRDVGRRFWENHDYNRRTSASYERKYLEMVIALNLAGSQPAAELAAFFCEDEIYCGLLNFRRLDAERTATTDTPKETTING